MPRTRKIRPTAPETLASRSVIRWDTIRCLPSRERSRLFVEVVCGHCNRARNVAVNNLDRLIGAGSFTGFCHPCLAKQPWANKGRHGATFRRKTKKGYIKVWKPEHPRADKRGEVYEHRLVMEAFLGRSLKPYEHIHHQNRRKDDNRPENLEIVTAAQHAVITRLEKRLDTLEAFIRQLGREPPP